MSRSMNLRGNVTIPLYDFYERWDQGKLLLPPHQRGDVWSDKKKNKWWKDIEYGGIMPGCIITYNLVGDNRLWINDGGNRVIHSLVQYIEKCKKGDKDYRSILYKCQITEQQIEYLNAQEAIEHFIQINMGTTATPYEVLKCNLIIELGDREWEKVWEKMTGKMYRVVEDILSKLECKKTNNREKKHTYLRDSLCLFYRFISKDASKWSPRVCINTLNPDTIKADSELEKRTGELFKSLGSESIREEIDNFERFLINYHALYHQIWLEEGISNIFVPSESHFRWWLAVAIYHKNNEFNFDNFKLFTRKFIKETQGKTTLIFTDKTGRQSTTSTTISKVNGLSTVLKALDINLSDFEEKESRRRERLPLKPGFVESHVKPFSKNGNGKVLPENALDNSRRGSREMDKETENKLERLKG